MLFTKSRLKTEPSDYIIKASINESKYKTSFDVFLSHSFDDKPYIYELKNILEGHGLSVYVDWLVDGCLDRNNVTTNTAEILRTRMKQSKSLLYATSINSSASKWMPWELGFFDGYKGKVAIIPIVENSYSKYEGQEYLGLYPYIDEAKIQNSDNMALWINKANMSSKNVRSWIND